MFSVSLSSRALRLCWLFNSEHPVCRCSDSLLSTMDWSKWHVELFSSLLCSLNTFFCQQQFGWKLIKKKSIGTNEISLFNRERVFSVEISIEDRAKAIEGLASRLSCVVHPWCRSVESNQYPRGIGRRLEPVFLDVLRPVAWPEDERGFEDWLNQMTERVDRSVLPTCQCPETLIENVFLSTELSDVMIVIRRGVKSVLNHGRFMPCIVVQLLQTTQIIEITDAQLSNTPFVHELLEFTIDFHG